MPAYAATTGKNGLFSYTMRGNGTLTITKFDWSGYQKNTDIVIPQMIDGYNVTAIGDLAFSQGDVDVEKVELPDLAAHDGLSFSDWYDWFRKVDLKQPLAIIHFTKFRYGKTKDKR